MSKILVTGFEPFGLIGKFLRQTNSSQEIMAAIEEHYQGDVQCILLPVSKNATNILTEILETENPDGILSMGEHLFVGPQHVKIEPHAHDQPLRTLPTLSHLFADKLQSEFSQSLPECSKSSSIGSYYCNEVYKTALKWSNNSDQRPVTFIHTPVLGDRSKHIDQVFKVLDKMQASRTITPEV